MKIPSNHLKKKKVLFQFSDGSSSYFLLNIEKKEYGLEIDIKSNNLWKSNSINKTKNLEERSIFFIKRFFNKK